MFNAGNMYNNITNKSGDSRLRKQLNLFDFTPVSDNREMYGFGGSGTNYGIAVKGDSSI